MSLLSFFASLFSGRPAADRPGVTDVSMQIVRLDPPDGSTLKAGDPIQATVAWRYSKPNGRLGMWVKLELPDADPDYLYQGDGDARQAGSGKLTRHVALQRPGQVDALVLVAKDASSREVYRVRVPVAYTYVADPAQDALREDGHGSRILGITLDPPSPAVLRPGTDVQVRVHCEVQSRHGLRASATPVTDAPYTFAGSMPVPQGRGSCAQGFLVGGPGVVRQVRVLLLNEGGAAVDERFFDVDLRYEA